MKNLTFYRVLGKHDPNAGAAYGLDPQARFFLPKDGYVSDWALNDAQLGGGEFVDYLGNDLGARLCSSRLADALQKLADGVDLIQWLPVRVSNGDDIREYYVLHFPHPVDVLDRHASVLSPGGGIVKPVLSLERAAPHQVFTFPDSGSHRLFVSKSVRDVLAKEGYTGLEFTRASAR